MHTPNPPPHHSPTIKSAETIDDASYKVGILRFKMRVAIEENDLERAEELRGEIAIEELRREEIQEVEKRFQMRLATMRARSKKK